MTHHRDSLSGALPWQRLLLVGSALATLRAAQACTELGLAWRRLDGDAGTLVAEAGAAGCEALHPGEASAARQWQLARACDEADMAFIGPREALIAAMCDPDAGRQLMREAGLPLAEAPPSAPWLHLPVLADRQGRALALIEHERTAEGGGVAPSDRLTPEQRAYLGHLAVQGAQAVGLVGLATLSFTLEGNRLGFAAMQPGLTGFEGLAEVVTGLDLAVEQLRLVAGERLRRPRIGPMGHGPGRPGQARLRPLAADSGISGGPGIRLDRPGGAEGSAGVARLLVWGRDTEEAARRERRALAEWREQNPAE